MTNQYPPLIERTEVDGVAVVKDEVLPSGLSKHVGTLVPMNGTRVLTLADGTKTHGCRDCLYHGTRGEVKVHRAAEHNVPAGGGAKTPRAEAAGIPADALSRPIGELLELALYADEWETVLANVETQLEEAVAERDEARRLLKSEERAHDVLKRRVRKLVGDD